MTSGLDNSIRHYWEIGKKFCILTGQGLRPGKNDLMTGSLEKRRPEKAVS